MRPTTGWAAAAASKKANWRRSVPKARCIVRMMSPRSPRSRSVCSARGSIVQTLGAASLGQTHLAELLQATDHQRASQPLINLGRHDAEVHLTVLGQPLQRAIQTGPTVLADLAGQAGLDLTLGARPEPLGGQLGRPQPQTLGEVLTGDDQIPVPTRPGPG